MNNLEKERKWFAKTENLAKKVKILVKRLSKNNYVTNIAGLINEYFANHYGAIKLYMNFLEKRYNCQEYHIRINFILLWHSIYTKQIEKFSKVLLKNKINDKELLFFCLKCQNYFGNYNFSILFCKKLVKITTKEIERKQGTKLSHNLLLFCYNFIIRLCIILGKKDKLTDFTKKKRFYSDLNWSNVDKFHFFTFNNLVQTEKLLSYRKKIFGFFPKSIKHENHKNFPVIFNLWETNIEKKKNTEDHFYFRIIFNFIIAHVKWLSAITLAGLPKNDDILNFVLGLFSVKCFDNIFESYNPICRNFHIKISFLKKLAKIKLKKISISDALMIYKWIFEKNSKNFNSLNIIALMRRRTLSKKKAFHLFIKGLKIFIKKKYTVKRQSSKDKHIINHLIEKVEIFFEEKRIYAVSSLVLSLMLLNNQRIKNLMRVEKKRQGKKIEAHADNSAIKRYYSEIGFFENGYKLKEYHKFLEDNSSSFKKLESFVFHFIRKNKIFLTEKSLSYLVGKHSFLPEESNFLQICCIWISVKKKKFEKAYKIARLRCLSHPFCYQSWSILAKLENQIGILTSKTLRYSLRVLIKYPTSIPAIVFTGNHCSVFGSFGYSLAEYFQAYRWRKDSPFLNFSICLQYINGSFNRNIINPEYAIVLSLAFFSEYKKLRTYTIQTQLKNNFACIELDIEIFYNTARFYLFLGMNSLAFLTLQKALKRPFIDLGLTKKKRKLFNPFVSFLKKEIIFNMSLLIDIFGNRIIVED